ncbi:MAG: hypothetical protein ACI8Z7_000378 [Candidatus Nanohaloarchaea archaeon]|jgi:hypothetical protein
MKAIIYSLDSGRIRRKIYGDIPLENQRLKDDEGILTSFETEISEEYPEPITTGVEIPDDLSGKKVDLDSMEIVEDPDYEAPRTKEDIKQDLKNGDITQKEALIELLE